MTDSKGFRQPVYTFALSDEQDMELRGGEDGTLRDIPLDVLNGGARFSHGGTSQAIAQITQAVLA